MRDNDNDNDNGNGNGNDYDIDCDSYNIDIITLTLQKHSSGSGVTSSNSGGSRIYSKDRAKKRRSVQLKTGIGFGNKKATVHYGKSPTIGLSNEENQRISQLQSNLVIEHGVRKLE
eukprot:Awhi_evm1s5978